MSRIQEVTPETVPTPNFLFFKEFMIHLELIINKEI